MRANEIEIGGEYAVTRHADPFEYGGHYTRKGVVLRTETNRRRVAGVVVAVQYTPTSNPSEVWVANREIRMPWAEFVEERDRREHLAKQRQISLQQKRVGRARRALDLDAKIARALGTREDFRAFITRVHIDGSAMRAAQAAGYGVEVDDRGTGGLIATHLPNLRPIIEGRTEMTVPVKTVDAILDELESRIPASLLTGNERTDG